MAVLKRSRSEGCARILSSRGATQSKRIQPILRTKFECTVTELGVSSPVRDRKYPNAAHHSTAPMVHVSSRASKEDSQRLDRHKSTKLHGCRTRQFTTARVPPSSLAQTHNTRAQNELQPRPSPYETSQSPCINSQTNTGCSSQ